MNSARTYLLAGALAGFFSVALGAFGAHGLKHMISPEMLAVFNKGVHYQGIHALALLATGLLLRELPLSSLRWAGRFFTLGILLFCGSLYLLATTHYRTLGMITPVGGLSFLAGWLFLAIGSWSTGKTS
ncbi:DUF423 domain-containing protein [Thiolapillus sp.]